MLTNTRNIRIEWCDCDPAGIVFYPRYFEMFDTSTTALFERGLGMRKHEFLAHYKAAGHPLVDTKARFLRPLTFSDDVAIESTVEEFRRSSFLVRHRISKGGELAVEGFETRVWAVRDPADPGRIRSQPVPPDIVEKLSRS
jgi:4-hydroxybenzoyl-CoA thioesterase